MVSECWLQHRLHRSRNSNEHTYPIWNHDFNGQLVSSLSWYPTSVTIDFLACHDPFNLGSCCLGPFGCGMGDADFPDTRVFFVTPCWRNLYVAPCRFLNTFDRCSTFSNNHPHVGIGHVNNNELVTFSQRLLNFCLSRICGRRKAKSCFSTSITTWAVVTTARSTDTNLPTRCSDPLFHHLLNQLTHMINFFLLRCLECNFAMGLSWL